MIVSFGVQVVVWVLGVARVATGGASWKVLGAFCHWRGRLQWIVSSGKRLPTPSGRAEVWTLDAPQGASRKTVQKSRELTRSATRTPSRTKVGGARVVEFSKSEWGGAKLPLSRRLIINLLRRLGGSLALPAHPSGLGGRFLYPRFQIFGRDSGPEGRHVVARGASPWIAVCCGSRAPQGAAWISSISASRMVSPRWGS